MHAKPFQLLTCSLVLAFAVARVQAHEPASAPTAPGEPAPATPAPQTTPIPQLAPPQDATSAQATVKPAAPVRKKGKEEYTGPTTVVVLDPTPILDGEGRQRLDPDGKPMFNPPVKQIRDKKGHPVFDEKGQPVFQTAKDLGYDEKGKRIDAVKEKPPRTVVVNITRGTFTVDGMTGKAALNYDIPDFKYIYMYVPWIGTTIVSNVSFPGSKEQKDAFNDRTLTVTVGEHTLQLYSDTRLLGKKSESAFVLVDRDFKLPTSNPVVGYGPTLRAPYDWPGAKENRSLAGVTAPPIPQSLRPTLLLSACPTGQMRMPGPKPLPGQNAQVQPCVPIASAIRSGNNPSANLPGTVTASPAPETKPSTPAPPQ